MHRKPSPPETSPEGCDDPDEQSLQAEHLCLVGAEELQGMPISHLPGAIRRAAEQALKLRSLASGRLNVYQHRKQNYEIKYHEKDRLQITAAAVKAEQLPSVRKSKEEYLSAKLLADLAQLALTNSKQEWVTKLVLARASARTLFELTSQPIAQEVEQVLNA